MSYVGVIAAGGNGRRTGLGKYTSKALLPVAGRSLLGHNVDFLRRSGVDRVYVVTLAEYERAIHQVLLKEGEISGSGGVSSTLLLTEPGLGWAGTVGNVLPFIDSEDEVVLISCDNYHTVKRARRLDDVGVDVIFTYTRVGASRTDGPVFGRAADGDSWAQFRGADHEGDLFTGYVVVRGRELHRTLAGLPQSSRGEREITALLDVLWNTSRCCPMPYGGTYEDVADLAALARLELRLCASMTSQISSAIPGKTIIGMPILPSSDTFGDVQFGAGVLLHDDSGRVFLTERQDGAGWVMPGGIVDAGETYAAAAARELREEVGVDVAEDDLRLLGVYPTIGKHGGPACSVIFHARMPSAVLRVDRGEVRRFGTFDWEGTEKLTIPFNLDRAVRDHFAGRELDVRP